MNAPVYSVVYLPERNAASFEVFLVVASFYLALTILLGLMVRWIEARTRTMVG